MNTTTTEAAAPAVAERTPQLMLVEGNEAAALGVALARPDMVAVYPITPQTPIVDGSPCGVFSWRPPVRLVTAVSGLLDGTSRDR